MPTTVSGSHSLGACTSLSAWPQDTMSCVHSPAKHIPCLSVAGVKVHWLGQIVNGSLLPINLLSQLRCCVIQPPWNTHTHTIIIILKITIMMTIILIIVNNTTLKRPSSRCFTISSLCHELCPTCMLMWKCCNVWVNQVQHIPLAL